MYFFKSLNSILGILGNNPPIQVALSLFRSKCIPILMYSLAAIPLSKVELNSLSFVFNNIFCKIFKSKCLNIIAQCQHYCNLWPFYATVDYLRFNFLVSLFNNNLLLDGYSIDNDNLLELNMIAVKYNP